MQALGITPYWGGLLLLFARMTGVVFTAPLFSDPSVPTTVRVGLALALTAATEGFARVHVGVLTLAGFLVHLLLELAIGLAMGLVASAVVQAAAVFGGLVDAASGLSLAAVLNPAFGETASLFEGFATMLVLFVYAAGGGLTLLVTVLAASTVIVPVGQAIPLQAGLGNVVLEWAGGVFGTGLLLALPVLVALAVVNFAIGLLARILPQMNVFALSIGLGPFLSVFVLLLLLPLVVTVLGRYQESALSLVVALLHAL